MTETEQVQKALNEKFKAMQDKIDALTGIEHVTKETFKSDFEEINKALKEQGEEMAKLINGDVNVEKTFEGQIDKWFEDNKDKIVKSIGGGANVEFEVKAAHNMDTNQGVPGNGFHRTTNFNPANFNLANYSYIYDLVSMFKTNQAAVYYTELLPETEGYEEVLEGGVKGKISFKWTTNHVSYIKIAARIELTEEVVKDFTMMKSLAKEYLFKKHNIKKAKSILDYAISQASGFAAGGFAAAITTPNFLDLVNTAAATIMMKENYADDEEAYANVVLMNPLDYVINIVTAKDADGRPLYPVDSINSQVNLGGLLVKPHKSIATGKIFISDMSKVNVSSYDGYTIRIGHYGNQFIENSFTMIGESKFHRYIKNQDKKAFLIDDIAVIEAAITKP